MLKADELLESIEALRGDVKALAERLARLEAGARESGTAIAPSSAAKPVQLNGRAEPMGDATAEEISEEVLLAISAAVAAFLGERQHIRQIRLISSHHWGMRGRVNIQASHALNH
jgi:methylmalonyl-CoA carboxyltransferase large subunit